MRYVACFFGLLFLAGCGASATSGLPASSVSEQAVNAGHMNTDQAHAIPIGSTPTPAPGAQTVAPVPGEPNPPTVNPCNGGPAKCHARERDDIPPQPASLGLAPTQIPGLQPSDLQSAYHFSNAGGTGTIAIVVAYNDPTAASDLAVYRSEFGLGTCTGSCLRIVSSKGDNHLPPPDGGWSAETSIDLDMASAVCPRCSLLVVEANSDGMNDMIAALLEAVQLKPNVISNSWSIPESYAGPLLGSLFAHSGIAVVAGSGDSGAGVSWPAAEPSIIAVGGTTLLHDSAVARGWIETPWADAGYGCSAAFARPAWQTNVPCTTRAVADIAAVADPATGVAIYDSTPQGVGSGATAGGWEVYGGTSVATPIVASMIALSGNAPALSTPQYLYQHAALLNQIVAPSAQLQVGLGTPEGLASL